MCPCTQVITPAGSYATAAELESAGVDVLLYFSLDQEYGDTLAGERK